MAKQFRGTPYGRWQSTSENIPSRRSVVMPNLLTYTEVPYFWLNATSFPWIRGGYDRPNIPFPAPDRAWTCLLCDLLLFIAFDADVKPHTHSFREASAWFSNHSFIHSLHEYYYSVISLTSF